MKLLTFIILSILFTNIYASCGSSNCPLYHFHYSRTGGLYLRISYEYINQDQLYVGTNRSFIGAIPEQHDEVSTLNSLTFLQLQYGISDRLSFGFILPFIHHEHNHIHHDKGQDVWENWNFSGMGDIILLANYSLILPTMNSETYLSISGGIKLPTGITDAKNTEGEEAEVTIQPGSGSVDEVIGINFRHPLFTVKTTKDGVYSTIPLIIGLSYQIAGKGTNDYKFGNTFLANLGTDYQLTDKASLAFQVNGKFQGHSDPGKTGEPEENTGGKWIYFSPGLNFSIDQTLSFYGFIQLPVYQNVNGIQQTSRFNLQLGVTANTSLL